MKMVILAAGVGKRLRPLTADKPKCLVKYKDKPIIDYILEANRFIKDVAIVGGYKFEILKEYLKDKNIKFFENKDYKKTNMFYSLLCARDFFDDDLIISYGDIIYKKDILKKLIVAEGDFCVVVDKGWKNLWEKRMEDPLIDAETLKIKDNKIVEIGKKPSSFNDIEAQYIGLMKVSKNIFNRIFKIYLDKNAYMTDFIQQLIDERIVDITPVYINGGWMEFDNINDLDIDIKVME